MQANDTFFNRVKEVESLQAFLAGSPSNVIVLLGPPSCGKTGAPAPVATPMAARFLVFLSHSLASALENSL